MISTLLRPVASKPAVGYPEVIMVFLSSSRMLACLRIGYVFILTCLFPFNNQPDALIIQIYSVIKLYMFRASSLPIIRSFLLYIRHWQVSCRFLMTASKQS
jgi:hypothetical protein